MTPVTVTLSRLLVIAGILQAAAFAQAQPKSVEPPGYRSTVDAAIAEYDQGHFAESRALFEKAHALFPNARTLRSLGMAEFELRSYVASVQRLEEALASTVKPLTGTLRAETETLLNRARSFVGRITLTVAPPDANITLNGTEILGGPMRSLPLAVGDYTLEATAVGYTTQYQRVQIHGGQELELAVHLTQPLLAAPAASASPARPPAASESSIFESPWLWGAVGVVAAGTIVGVVLATSGDPGVASTSGGSTGITLIAR